MAGERNPTTCPGRRSWFLEWAPHLDVAAQPHHQQQWTAVASHRDAQQVAIDPGEREEPPAG
jgi:hypothetical protein